MPNANSDTNPALADADKAFERGDFAAVRRLARDLLKSDDAATRTAAQALLDRIKVDPVIVWLSAACVLFFVVVIATTLYR